MIYVELLRARRSLTWHVGIIALLTLAALYTANSATVAVDGSSHFAAGMPIAVSVFAPVATFFAMIYASSAGTSLNRENATRDISWTKPESRTRVALQFMLVDVAAIAIVYAVALLATTAVVVRIGVVPGVDAAVALEIVLGLGTAVMWYGLLQVLTFPFGNGARSLGGILWPVTLVDLGLTQVPGPIGAVARAIELINPLAYVKGIASNGKGTNLAPFAAPPETRALLAWVFALAFCALAVTFWPRKEA